MSLVMMINKIQSEQDYQEFLKIANKVIDTIYQNTTEDIKEIYRIIIWSLLMKMKVPQQQAQRMIEGLGVKGMGYLFENMKEIDIGKMQEESRKVTHKLEETKEQLEETKGKLDETKGQLKETKSQLDETKGQLYETKGQLEETKGQLDQAKEKISETENLFNVQKKRAEDAENKLLSFAEKYVVRMHTQGETKEKTISEVVENYGLTRGEATNLVERCWK